METTFNFKQDTELIYALHPTSEIILHINRLNNSKASLYFTNQLNEEIDIPSGFIIYHIKKPNSVDFFRIKLQPNETTNDYTLYWRKNYDIVYNGETIYNIRNEKTWTLYN
jgi:hypothetical protein